MRAPLSWRAIMLCGVISISVLVTPPVASQETDHSRLTLERIFEKEEFKVERYGPVRWLADGSGFTTLEPSPDVEKAKDVIRCDAATGECSVFVAAGALVPSNGKEPLSIKDYELSDDGTQLLIFTNTKKVWRRHTRGDYWLLDLATGRLRQLGGETEESTMMFAKLSPDGTRVAWVDFNYKDLYAQNLGDLTVTRLTDDGGGNVINGTSDWVNEEEFGVRDGFRWSPDGSHIAYWQFDTSGVGIFNLINNTDTLYPKLQSIVYPKAGTTNSACRIGVVSANGGATTWFEPEGNPRDHYIPKMGWAENPNEVWFIRLNRLQNTAKMLLGTVETGNLRTVFIDSDAAWVDMRHHDPMWLKNGQFFTWLSERDGWRHLYLVSRSGDELRLVTSGDYDLTELVGIDEAGGWAYFTASPDDPTSRYLYRARLTGEGGLHQVTPEGPTGTHVYDISDNAAWAIHTFSSREQVPRTTLVSLPDHTLLRVLEDNTDVRNAIDAIAKVPIESFRVAVAEGVAVDGWMIKPPDFNPAQIYPLLIYVYGEPGGQTVQNQWGRSNGMWHFYLAQQGYIVASLDNRGTPAPRGRDWRKSVYRQIGVLASADQAAGVEAMLEQFPFLDPERVGVWGWSGGGSMTLNLLFRYPDIYSLGIAVAPVPDQKLYDTIYQERYMGLPEDNAKGYAEGSPITHAEKLEGDLLLIHGTGDDNVHYQGSELLINALIRHGKLFEMMSYPNRSHGISEGEGTSLHLRRTMTRFLEEHLEAGAKPMPPPRRPETDLARMRNEG